MKWRRNHLSPLRANRTNLCFAFSFFILGCGCARTEAPSSETAEPKLRSEAHKSLPTPTRDAIDAREELISRAKAAIQRHRLASLSVECLFFEISNDSPNGSSLVGESCTTRSAVAIHRQPQDSSRFDLKALEDQFRPMRNRL